MDTFKHIVCGVDFSEASEQALQAALDLAQKWEAKVTVLHAYQLPDVWFPDVTIPDKETLDKQVREGAEKNLNALTERVAREGVRMEHATVEGDARKVVIEGALWREADLIVVGTHGITGLKHAILGSVAEAVVRHSPLPVLSLHGKPAAS